MTLALLLLACARTDPGGPPPPGPEGAPAPVAASPHLRFVPRSPTTSEDGITVFADARLGSTLLPLRFTPLLVQDRAVGDGLPFGTVLDARGQPLEGDRCAAPDFNGLLSAHGRNWLFTHLECAPAALVLTELGQAADRSLVARSSTLVDTSAIGGANQLCAGTVTPWGSLLSGEEFETDAALLRDGRIDPEQPGMAAGQRYADHSRYEQWARYHGEGAQPSPYLNGWMVETQVLDETGATRITRRGAMGRMSHELAVIMPDQRTVYMSDDTTHAVLAMFVADAAGDLSSGTLYAARWALSADPRGQWAVALSWVDLGHADDALVDQALARGPRFEELFRRTPLARGEACPTGMTQARAPQGRDECLAPVPGSEPLASRVETRRAAALAGATVELQKAEGLALDPDGRRLFLATTAVEGGMLAGDPPQAEADHLRLPANPCGVVWAFDLQAGGGVDSAGKPIQSEWLATTGAPAVEGWLDGDTCAEGGISHPDNLAYIPTGAPGQGVLLIAEDSSRSPNRLWAWQDRRLVPILAAPPAPLVGRMGEVSGLAWVPSMLGAGWITVSIQHPGGRSAVAGVLGPFPERAGVRPDGG